MELDVALIVSCRLWSFVSSDESRIFFHSPTSADMDAGMTGRGNSVLGGRLC